MDYGNNYNQVKAKGKSKEVTGTSLMIHVIHGSETIPEGPH